MQLKGTTKIELTDVNTGEVEVYEDHNIVTNVLNDIFRPIGLSKMPSRLFKDFIPYYKTLLGGILCFDVPIEENPDNYYPPVDANLIGCASYGVQNNTTNTCRGGFNQTESEVNLEDGYVKYVYDFGTSQANGTIASVCLTHKNAGYTGYGYKNATYMSDLPLMIYLTDETLQYVMTSFTGANTSSRFSGMTVGVSEMIFLIEREKDCVYYFKVVDKNHINITKRKAYLSSLSILDNVYYTKPLIEEIELEELGTDLTNGYYAYNYDHATDCLYICTCPSYYVATDGSILVTQIKMDTWEISQYVVKNTSRVKLDAGSNNGFFVAEGFLYVKGYSSPYDLYKFEITNPANVVEFSRINTSEVYAWPKVAINGRIYYENGDGQLLIANTKTNELITPESRTLFNYGTNLSVTPLRNEPLMYYVDKGQAASFKWYMMCNYLATINNLDTPVTKTADKTMKITYIIQEQ